MAVLGINQMPYIPSSTNIAGPVTQSSATIASHEQLEQERQSARPGFFGGLLGSTALATIDFVAPVASSIPFSPFARGEIGQASCMERVGLYVKNSVVAV